MANGVFNIARGKIGYYGGLPAASDGYIIVVFETAEADDTFNNHDTLNSIKGTNTEWTATNYSRKTHTDVTYSIDDTGNTAKVVIGSDDTWNTVTGNAAVKLVICYDPDTGTGDDTTIIPLTYHDWSVTPNGGNITANHDQTNGHWSSS